MKPNTLSHQVVCCTIGVQYFKVLAKFEYLAQPSERPGHRCGFPLEYDRFLQIHQEISPGPTCRVLRSALPLMRLMRPCSTRPSGCASSLVYIQHTPRSIDLSSPLTLRLSSSLSTGAGHPRTSASSSSLCTLPSFFHDQSDRRLVTTHTLITSTRTHQHLNLST